MDKKYAAVAITRNGIKLALTLGEQLGSTEVFCYAKYSGKLEKIPGNAGYFPSR